MVGHHTSSAHDLRTRLDELALRLGDMDDETRGLLADVITQVRKEIECGDLEQERAENKRLKVENAVLRAAVADAETDQRVLSALIDFAPEGIAYASLPGPKITRISKFGEKMVSRSLDQVGGETAVEQLSQWRFIDPHTQTHLPPEEYPLMRAVLRSEVLRNKELIIDHPDGRRTSVLCSASPVYDENNLVVGGVVTWQEITEMQAARDALKRSEQRNREILSAITDCYYHLDFNWRITEINPAALEYFNRPESFFLGQSIWDLYPAGVDSLFEAEYLRAVAEQRPIHFESPSRMVDRWAEVFAYPDETGLSVYFRDISIRKHTEQALRETNQKLKQVLNSITEAYFVLDRQWKIVDYNRVAERDFLKKPPEELLGKVFWEVYPAAVGNEYYRQYHRAFASGRPVHFEAISGLVPHWFEVHAYPRGDVLEIYLRDIDDRKRAEQALAYQAYLLENAHDAMVAIDAQNLRITSWNRAAEDLLGYTTDEVLHQDAFAVLHLPLDESARERLDHSLNKTGRAVLDINYQHPDGHEMILQAGILLLRDENGQPFSISATARDVTEERQAQARLKRSQQQISEILESISDGFLAMDCDWNITYINSRAAHVTGHRPEELVGQSLWESLPYLVNEASEPAIRRAMEKSAVTHLEIHRPENDQFLALSIYPTAEGLSIYWLDVTEVRRDARLREALLEENTRQRLLFEQLFNQSPVAIGVYSGPNHIVKLANPAMLEMSRGHGEVIGRPIAEVWSDVGERFVPLIDQVFRTGEPHEIKNSYMPVMRDGQMEPGYFGASWTALRNSAGEVEGILALVFDNTTEMLSRQEREAQAELIRAVVENSPLGLAVLEGEDHKIVLANPTYANIMGCSPAEVEGRSVDDFFFNENDRNDGARKIAQVLETGQPFHADAVRSPGLPGEPEQFWNIDLVPLADRRILMQTFNVTEQMTIRRAMQEEQNRLQAILQNAPEGIVVADAQARVLFTNPAADRLYARPVPLGKEFDSHAQLELAYADGRDSSPRNLPLTRSALDGETFTNVDLVIRWPDGEERRLLVNTAPILDEQGKITGAVGTFQDVTQIRNIEQAYQRSEQLLRTVLDHLPVGVWVADETGQLIYGNPGAQRIWAGAKLVGPEEFHEYKAWWAETGEPLAPQDWAVIRAVRNGETSLNELLEIECFDGSHKIILNAAVPVKDNDGELLGAVVLNEDVTEQRKADDALRASEAKVRRLVDANLIGVVFGNHGTIVEANNAFLKLLGYSREDLTDGAMNWRNFTPAEYLPIDEEHSREAANQGACTPYEKEFIAKDGRRVPVLIGYALLSGSQHDYVAFVVDLTARKLAEKNDRFLAQLGEQLLHTLHIDRRMEKSVALVGKFMGASRCVVNEVNVGRNQVLVKHEYRRSHLPSLIGEFSTKTLPKPMLRELQRGNMVVINDTQNDPLTAPRWEEFYKPSGIAAMVMMPRLEESEWVATLQVAMSEPHQWRSDEMDVIRTSADLIWLALRNGRLMEDLRETQERFDQALRNSPVVYFTMDRNLRYTWIYNPRHGFRPEDVIGKTDYDLLEPQEAEKLEAIKREVLETCQGQRREISYNVNNLSVIYDMTVEPVLEANGECSGISVSAIEVTEQRRMEAEMRVQEFHSEIQGLILEHRERERLEIARDLHDGPLQEMIAINFGLTEAIGIHDRDERLKKIAMLQDAIQHQIRDLRSFCSELRPPALAPFGLEKAIQSHADTFRNKNPNIELHLDLMRDRQSLSEELRLSLYRIYQELLNNVVRHSNATEVTVRLWLTEDEVTLAVEDNGRGFSVPGEWLEMARTGHLGLVGVRERAESLGGNVEISSNPGQGTTVLISVPRY